jgi:ABC-2 type transporter
VHSASSTDHSFSSHDSHRNANHSIWLLLLRTSATDITTATSLCHVTLPHHTLNSYLYIVWPALYALVVYWCVGLRPSAGHFFLFLFIFISEIMAAQSLGMLISAAIKDFAAAQSFSFVLVRTPHYFCYCILLLLLLLYTARTAGMPPPTASLKAVALCVYRVVASMPSPSAQRSHHLLW